MSAASPTTPTSKTVPPPSTPGNASNTGIVKQLLRTFSDLNLNLSEGSGSQDLTSEQFDVKKFSSAIIKTNQLSEHLSSLSQSLNTLDKEIREQVSVHHHDLLHQAINIETLDEMLDMIHTRIGSLKSTSERLRAKIGAPYNELNLRILQLSRLQAACDTLRRIKGVLFYAAKLRGHMSVGVRDLVKSAQALNELDFLLKNFDDAAEIQIIEEDVHFAHRARREVEEQAQVILDKGMQHQDQTKISTALQVFYSLGVLDKKLQECLRTSERNFQQNCQNLLDTTNLTLQSTSSAPLHTSVSSAAFLGSNTGSSHQFPGRATMPNVGSMGQFRAQLWTNVEKLMDAMYDSCAQVLQLQIILEKKKDLVSNLLYLDEIDFAAIFPQKMFLANKSAAGVAETDNQSEYLSSISVYESICAILPSELIKRTYIKVKNKNTGLDRCFRYDDQEIDRIPLRTMASIHERSKRVNSGRVHPIELYQANISKRVPQTVETNQRLVVAFDSARPNYGSISLPGELFLVVVWPGTNRISSQQVDQSISDQFDYSR